MTKLTEPQKRVLRMMVEFDCDVRTYEGMQLDNRARAHFTGQYPRRRFISIGTVRALLRRGMLVETDGPWDPPLARHLYILTPKGRKAAKELQDAQAD